ncbi:MAG TPA: site-specific integrase [Phycisphaerae bacterium]|jgi:integrase|nr:site-specific integrase [Phycisphaerae bacterium]
MPKLSHHVPKLSRHLRGNAFVKIAGQQIWLGKYGQPQTQEKYDRLVGQWLANGRQLPSPGTAPTTVAEVVAAYWTWAQQRYTPAEAATIKAALRVVCKSYASLAAHDYGPNCLRASRAEMVRIGWSRRQINRQISRVRGLFRWAASHEMVHESVYNQLATVESLKRGEAVERPRIKPVPRSMIRSLRPYLSRPIRALMDLQLLTGARAGELVHLRLGDLLRSGPVWTWQPEDHKTAHFEKSKIILFGPRAQKILHGFLAGKKEEDFLFSPHEAIAERHEKAKGSRRPNQLPNPRNTDRTVGPCYTTNSYRRALHRAADLAFPPAPTLPPADASAWRRKHRWGPHRLRHNAATFLRREFGIEVAQVILGHSSLSVTQIYAEVTLNRAMKAMEKVG